MNKKQIVVIAAVAIVTGYLYSLSPKGLVKPPSMHANAGVAGGNDNQAAPSVTLAAVSDAGKTAIGKALSAKIIDLEGQLKEAPESGKLALEKQLGAQWYDDNQPAPAAFYYQAAAKKENKFEDWLKAGNDFNEAYKFTQDTSSQSFYVSNAAEAFQNALKLNPKNQEAKTGLGIADVNGASMPMQGIGLLLEVVKDDPKNVNALLNLGMFSMKSGQYEKAVDRFKTIIAIKPGFEAYYYLAESYKQLGRRSDAVAAYKKCKEMMPDPVFGKQIDQYIKELQ